MDRNMVEEARKSSVTNGKRYGVKYSTYKKNVKKSFICGAMACILLTGMVSGVKTVVDKVDVDRAKYNVSQSIAALTSDIGSEDYEHLRNLVSQHTFRTQDNQNCWYDTDGIAEEILDMDTKYSFDSRTLNAILYSVYDDMDYNAFKNMSEVIISLNLRVSANEKEHNNIFNNVVNCTSLDDYLIRNHMIDDKGYPSLGKFKELGLTDLLSMQDYINSLVEKEGKTI